MSLIGTRGNQMFEQTTPNAAFWQSANARQQEIYWHSCTLTFRRPAGVRGGIEPSMIDEAVIEKTNEIGTPSEGVASFQKMTAQERQGYLRWLQHGRSVTLRDLNFLKLHFLGLERRALCNRWDQSSILNELNRQLDEGYLLTKASCGLGYLDQISDLLLYLARTAYYSGRLLSADETFVLMEEYYEVKNHRWLLQRERVRAEFNQNYLHIKPFACRSLSPWEPAEEYVPINSTIGKTLRLTRPCEAEEGLKTMLPLWKKTKQKSTVDFDRTLLLCA